MSKGRRRHTAEQKAELLRQHVAEKKPVSEVCNEAEIQPSLFYTWQRELLAGAEGARGEALPSRGEGGP